MQLSSITTAVLVFKARDRFALPLNADNILTMTDRALESIPKTYDAAVRALAAAHGGANIVIYSMADPAQQVVRLIEVSADFPAAGVERLVPPDGKEWIVPVFPMGRA